MAIELIPIYLFAQLMELSEKIRENAGLIFFTSLFGFLWVAGVITVVRRWRSE